jgi:Tfp pilus assembly protein PilN
VTLTRFVDIDILPPQYRPRAISVGQVLTGIILIALLAGLVPVYQRWDQARLQTAERQAQLEHLKLELRRERLDQGQLADLQKQIDQARSQARQLQAESQSLNAKQTPRAAGISASIALLVPRIQVIKINQTGRVYTLAGWAGSQTLVLDYARALQVSNRFALVRIVSILNTDSTGLAPAVQFVIEMTH